MPTTAAFAYHASVRGFIGPVHEEIGQGFEMALDRSDGGAISIQFVEYDSGSVGARLYLDGTLLSVSYPFLMEKDGLTQVALDVLCSEMRSYVLLSVGGVIIFDFTGQMPDKPPGHVRFKSLSERGPHWAVADLIFSVTAKEA